ncbi:MAG: hypothetical protein V4492_07305 [Chlamydiota bacterium]
MSVAQPVQNNSFCQNVTAFASQVGTSFANFCSSAAETAKQVAQKVAEFAAPYFAKGKEFAQNNQKEIIVAGAFLAIGAILAKIFCSSTKPADEAQKAPAAVAQKA